MLRRRNCWTGRKWADRRPSLAWGYFRLWKRRVVPAVCRGVLEGVEMPTCIYCRVPTIGTEGVAHVIPEAIGANELILPAGAVCEPCNSYFGQTLDPMLVLYPGNAVTLQFWGIAGKGRKPRQQLGSIRRAPEDGSTSLQGHSLRVETGEDGKRTVYWDLPIEPKFQMLKFRRSLFYIALNTVALTQGVEYALDSRFDEVRRYVRKPHPREAWPFARGRVPGSSVPRRVNARYCEKGRREVIVLDLLECVFAVALCDDGTFAASAAVEGHEFIGQEVKRPPRVRMKYVES